MRVLPRRKTSATNSLTRSTQSTLDSTTKTIAFPRTSTALLEIDHILIFMTQPPKLDYLESLGLMCESPRLQHLERGTASRVIFFENVYLEFTWVEDELAAEVYAQKTGIDFKARSNSLETQASPFAFAMRQRLDWSSRLKSLVSQVWDANNSAEAAFSFSSENLRNPLEPLCFVIPEALTLTVLMSAFSERFQALINHPIGIQRLTQSTLQHHSLNGLTLSNSVQFLLEDGLLELETGSEVLLQLVFDDHRQGHIWDLREIDIPILLKF